MSKSCWLIGLALATLMAAPAMSQQPAMAPSQGEARMIHEEALRFQPDGPNVIFRREGPSLDWRIPTGEEWRPNTTLIGDPPTSSMFAPGKYWLGIQCSPVPPALRSHLTLPEKQGLLVIVVSKDSPAAKAGLAQYDILLRVGDKAFAEPRDLLTAVEAAKDAKLKIELIRGGKPQTIEVTPAKRPEQLPGGPVQAADPTDWNTIQSWLESMAAGQAGAGQHPPMQFRFFQPGAIVPKDAFIGKPLPGNVKVFVNREGKEPAKITVIRGNDKWEVTENELGKIPAELRPFVEQMLGRGMVGVVGGAVPPGMSGGFSASGPMFGSGFQFPIPSPGMMQPRPFAGPSDQRLEKRFDELDRRIDKLIKMLEELNAGHAKPAAPEHHEEE